MARIVPERLRSLDPAGAEAVLAITQRASNVFAAMQDLALAAGVRSEELDLADLDGGWYDGTEHRPSSVKIVGSSVAPLLRLTPRSAESRVADALCLVDELPLTRTMALEGLLDSRQSRVIVDVAQLVQVGARALFDAAITSVPGLAELTPARLRRLCERTAALIDAGAIEQRAQRGVDDRFVRVSPGADPGMAWWTASLPSYVSMQAWAAIDALAHEYVRADPGRSIDQARADAFADLLLGSAQVTTTVELIVPDLHRCRRHGCHRCAGLRRRRCCAARGVSCLQTPHEHPPNQRSRQRARRPRRRRAVRLLRPPQGPSARTPQSARPQCPRVSDTCCLAPDVAIEHPQSSISSEPVRTRSPRAPDVDGPRPADPHGVS